jgi:MFS family permease
MLMNERAKISDATMILLGMGQLGTLFFWSFHGASMSLFLNDFTDSTYKIGFVLSLAGVANCLVPIVVGRISDRTRSRHGRRRPYIVAGGLVMFGSTMAFAHMPTLGAAALMAGIMFFSIAFCSVPYLALLPDITPPEQLGKASGYLNLLGGIGLIAYQAAGANTWDNYPIETIYLVAVVFAVSMFITVAFIKEPSVSSIGVPEKMHPLRYLAGVIKETNVTKFLAAVFFISLGLNMIFPFVTLFLVEEMGIAEGKSILVMLTASIVETIVILPLGMLSDRFDKKKLMSYMIVLMAVTSPLIAFSQNFTHALLAMGLMGIPIAGIVAVGYAFFLDLIPKGRAAEFVGFYAFCIGLAQIVALQVGGKLIDIIGFRLVFASAGILMLLGFFLFQFIQIPKKNMDGAQTFIPDRMEHRD